MVSFVKKPGCMEMLASANYLDAIRLSIDAVEADLKEVTSEDTEQML